MAEYITIQQVMDSKPDSKITQQPDPHKALQNKGWNDALKEWANNINSIPTRTIIQCEQCKRWVAGRIEKDYNFIPPYCTLLKQPMHASDFCSSGEPKS